VRHRRRGGRHRSWRRLCFGTAFLDQLKDLITNLWFDRTELVFDLETILLAESQQIFAFHVQFAGQGKDPNSFFLLRLQAELPVVRT
jgi:hypothetical protein